MFAGREKIENVRMILYYLEKNHLSLIYQYTPDSRNFNSNREPLIDIFKISEKL